MFAVSFGIPYHATGGGYARRFSREPWPHEEILNVISANSSLRHGDKEMLLMGADRAAFNANNVELAVVALQLPFSVENTAHERDLDTLRQRLAQASFSLYKEGGEPESPAFNPYVGDLARSVADTRRFQRIPYDRRLPDGGMACIYKNLASARRPVVGQFVKSGFPNPEEFAVDFGGILALTGFSVVTTGNETAVKLRWRCLNPPDREYWCFTHLIDASNRIVAQLDHRLLGGEPPLRAWRSGDGGEEEIRLRLPAGAPAVGMRPRFGIYDPPSGERLHVRPLETSISAKFSLTDQSTALLAPN
jgi:hypothetical protein